jgi:hypothetical protein
MERRFWKRKRDEEKKRSSFFLLLPRRHRRPFLFAISTKPKTHPLADNGPSEDERHVDRVPSHQELCVGGRESGGELVR